MIRLDVGWLFEQERGAEMKTEVRKVTPAEARSILTQNEGKNPRKMQAITVRKYARDMAFGRWENNGSTISFNGDGRLIDGYHRLSAMVESNTTLDLVLIYGVPSSRFIDTGRLRGLGTELANAGHVNVSVLGSAAAAVLDYNHYPYQRGSVGKGFTQSEVFDFVQRHPEFTEQALVAKRVVSALPSLSSAAVVAAMLHMTSTIDQSVALSMMEEIRTGEGLSAKSPTLKLRNLVIATKERSRGPLARRWLMAVLTKTWNSYSTGKDVSTLRFAEVERFPVLRGYQGYVEAVADEESGD